MPNRVNGLSPPNRFGEVWRSGEVGEPGGQFLGGKKTHHDVLLRDAAGEDVSRGLALLGRFGFEILKLDEFSEPAPHRRVGQRQGLAKSTSTLVLTCAERRARLLLPWKSEDEKIDLLLQAVRDPDLA